MKKTKNNIYNPNPNFIQYPKVLKNKTTYHSTKGSDRNPDHHSLIHSLAPPLV